MNQGEPVVMERHDGEASGRIKGMKWQCLGVKFRGMDSHGASNEGRKCVEGLG